MTGFPQSVAPTFLKGCLLHENKVIVTEPKNYLHISNGTKTKTLTIRNSLFSHAMKYKMCSYPYQSQLLN